MYYEKQILPVDDAGNFLLAVHFSRHKVGGECIRESAHAFFAIGNIENPSKLKDLTSLFCIERPPNKDASKELLETAKIQMEVVNQPESAWKYNYHASKALEVSLQVPRQVLATRNGLVHIGMDADIDDLEAGTSEFVQRIIDTRVGKIVDEYRSTDIPIATPRIFPKAISDDGKLLVSFDVQGYNKIYAAEFSSDKYKCNHRFKELYPVTEFIYQDNHWIGIDEEKILRIPKGSEKPTSTFESPKGGIGWTAVSSYNGRLIAMGGDRGSVFTVSTVDGSLKSYFPHVGANRDDIAFIKLSDDGCWMASKLMLREDVVLTDLSSGESWVAAQIANETVIEQQEDEYKSESSIPACFNFIGDRLLVSDQEIREVPRDRPKNNNFVFVSEQGKKGARKPLKLNPNDPIDKLVEKAKLSQHAESIQNLFYPGCLIKTKKPKKSGWNQPNKKGAFELGVSRLGGWPDLPKGTEWPVWNNRPMSFLGQINLTEVAVVQPNIRIPKKGLLLFFVGCNENTFERDPFDKDMFMLELMPSETNNPDNAVRVIHAASTSSLKRTMYEGETLPELFSPCGVTLKKGALSLPHESTSSYDGLSIEAADVSHYNELLNCLSGDEIENQLLGYPTLLQSTPLEWGPENQSLGRDFFFIPDSEEEIARFSAAASRWGLLLQLTSDVNPDYSWGDAGNMYIYGLLENMENGDFSRCYLNFEN